MTFDEYQAEVERTRGSASLAMIALGITGEAGEIADMVKKVKYHGHALDKGALIKELGDALWYLAAMMNVLGVSGEEVMDTNVRKLRQRYPNGFSSADSIARVDIGRGATLGPDE